MSWEQRRGTQAAWSALYGASTTERLDTLQGALDAAQGALDDVRREPTPDRAECLLARLQAATEHARRLALDLSR